MKIEKIKRSAPLRILAELEPGDVFRIVGHPTNPIVSLYYMVLKERGQNCTMKAVSLDRGVEFYLLGGLQVVRLNGSFVVESED